MILPVCLRRMLHSVLLSAFLLPCSLKRAGACRYLRDLRKKCHTASDAKDLLDNKNIRESSPPPSTQDINIRIDVLAQHKSEHRRDEPLQFASPTTLLSGFSCMSQQSSSFDYESPLKHLPFDQVPRTSQSVTGLTSNDDIGRRMSLDGVHLQQASAWETPDESRTSSSRIGASVNASGMDADPGFSRRRAPLASSPSQISKLSIAAVQIRGDTVFYVLSVDIFPSVRVCALIFTHCSLCVWQVALREYQTPRGSFVRET